MERGLCRMQAERGERNVNHLVQCVLSDRTDGEGVRWGSVDNTKGMLRVTGQNRSYGCDENKG
jgi:hypothetical protein